MNKLKLLWRILKRVEADKIFIGFIFFILVISLAIKLVEPEINTYGDSLWYCFAVVTTIGFGDFTVVTAIGRTLSVILSLYGIIVLALIPSIIVGYFMESSKKNINDSTEIYLDKLENLDKLSLTELKELSNLIKKRRNKL